MVGLIASAAAGCLTQCSLGDYNAQGYLIIAMKHGSYDLQKLPSLKVHRVPCSRF